MPRTAKESRKGEATERRGPLLSAVRHLGFEMGDGRGAMTRSYLLVNLTNLNYLPMMERWFYRDKVMETISQMGPMLYRYVTYRAVPPPEGGADYAYYNWRMIEHWWHESPFRKGVTHGSALAEYWPPHYNEAVGLLSESEGGNQEWNSPAPVLIFVPARATEDFKGAGLSLADDANLRWVTVIKYPEGVSREEGDDWYINVHAKEVCEQPGLKRFFSFHAVEPSNLVGPWVRVSELWYENHDAWRKAVIGSPPKYTKPSWATYDRYPFLKPGADLVSTFLLERPECDFLRDYRGYVVTA